jgi:DNA-binding IclR family transcriptional regulator
MSTDMADVEAVPALAAATAAPTKNAGSQTLDRGIRALKMVAAAPGGMTIQEVADQLEVHRTIAHRLLGTLTEHHLIARGPDNRFRAGGGLTALASGVQSTLRDTAMPIMRELAEELESTLVLLVREGEEVVGIAVAAPTKGTYHLAFRTGSRHPLGRGSAGICLLAALPPRPGERPEVTRARAQGFSVSKGEVEPGAHGLAVLIRQGDSAPNACLNLITYRDDIMAGAAPVMLEGAARISALLT